MTEEQALQIATEMVAEENNIQIATVDQNGYPCIKGLIKIKNNGLKEFFFTSNVNTDKVKNIQYNNKGCLYISKYLEYQGVSFRGTFQIMSLEEASIDKSFIPEGLRDQEYCAIKFITEEANVYASMLKRTVKIQ